MKLPSRDDVKLIVLDVDGTLLTSEGVIHPKTLAAFTKLRAAEPNLPIVISSGKQHNSCQWIREALGLPTHFPSSHCNGALIYGEKGIWHQHGLHPDIVKHVVAGTQQYGTFIFSEDEAILVTQGDGVHHKDWCNLAVRYDRNVRDCTQEADCLRILQQVASGGLVVPKVTICCDESDMAAVKRVMDALPLTSPLPFKMTRAIPWIFEAIAPDVHKGTAIVQICESLENVSPEQVLAFGDGENDVDMFRVAGHSVAMGNAMPAALAVAKYTTTSNDEGGVGHFIEQVWDL